MKLNHEHLHQTEKALALLQNLTTDRTGVFGSSGRRLAMNNSEPNRYLPFRGSHEQIDLDVAFAQNQNQTTQEAWLQAINVRTTIMNELPLVKIDPSLYRVAENAVILKKPHDPTIYPSSYFSIDEVELSNGAIARPFSMESQLLIMSLHPNNLRTKDLPEWLRMIAFFSRHKEILRKPAAEFAIKHLQERYVRKPHHLLGKVVANIIRDCYREAIPQEVRENKLHLGVRLGRQAPVQQAPYSKPEYI